MRCRPAPCEKVMLSRASVDHRLTGTDSSMKLRRLSLSDPSCRPSGEGCGGRERAPPSRRVRRLPSGFNGRVSTEGEIKLLLILSPIALGRNDFRTHVGLRARNKGLACVSAVGYLSPGAARLTWETILGVGRRSEKTGQQKHRSHSAITEAEGVPSGQIPHPICRVGRRRAPSKRGSLVDATKNMGVNKFIFKKKRVGIPPTRFPFVHGR